MNHEPRMYFPHDNIHIEHRTDNDETRRIWTKESWAPIALDALAYSPDYTNAPSPSKKKSVQKEASATAHHPPRQGKEWPQGKKVTPRLHKFYFVFSTQRKFKKLDSIKKLSAPACRLITDTKHDPGYDQVTETCETCLVRTRLAGAGWKDDADDETV